MSKDPKLGDLVISETRASVWSYHVRVIGPEGFKPSGGENLVAMCGKPLGWDTRIPLESWGRKGNTPDTWCATCEVMAAAKKGTTE